MNLTYHRSTQPSQTCGRSLVSAGTVQVGPDRSGSCPCSAQTSPLCPDAGPGQSAANRSAHVRVLYWENRA
ncbi:hypothetical protein DPMN_079088 [Dreissena polymorpha]|uniref:Uncharacterized protein n=1 Tax=Dreissena polymorpha TaxID=45954 RepID=A0A9D3YRM8_DREPO|nr:hypothetical protein DPMN_079088 [Dreissena polymorpha]